ncbi:MAG: hypothetical protein AB8C95_15005, partial [Phycisphaeraceae bacterium]
MLIMHYKSLLHSRLGIITPVTFLLLLGVTGAWMSHESYESDLANAKHEYRQESHHRSVQTKEDVENVFQSMYEQLRTIGRLPGLKAFSHDQHGVRFRGGGKAFDKDA